MRWSASHKCAYLRRRESSKRNLIAHKRPRSLSSTIAEHEGGFGILGC